MRLELTGRHIRITPGLRRLVEEALEKLDRLLHDNAVSMQAVLQTEKQRHRVEMTLHIRGEHFFHGSGSARDWELAVNQALQRVNLQARKQKEKWVDGKRRGVSAAKLATAGAAATRAGRLISDDGRERGVRIIRARRTAAKPMSIDEAAMEVGDGAGEFIVFRNANTDAVNVLFRRPDGNLGLIEPEA